MRTASLFRCVVVIVPVSFVSVIDSFCGVMQSTDTPVNESLLHSVDQILSDPKGKEYLLSKIGLSSSDVETHRSEDNRRLTPSGMSAGVWDTWPRGWPPFWPYGMPPSGGGPPSVSEGCTSGLEKRSVNDDQDLDSIQLLDESEALELVEFDPSVEQKGAWAPPQVIVTFLEKHFNRALLEEEREGIMKDFPKPKAKILTAPKLDDQVKDHIKSMGKDPHFGSEKSLYKLQEQVLDVAGPLTCLWADLLNKDANISTGDVLLLIQRALVLLGSVSHNISQERRKIAWSRINPKLKALAEEDYDKRDTNLFGPGFLEKASKRLEVNKTMEKVSTPQRGGYTSKRPRYDNDKSDLRSFLARGASARYGGKRNQRQQSYKSKKLFQANTKTAPTKSQNPSQESK